MNTGEAERHIKNAITAIYSKEEAATIADWIMEHLTSFSKGDRLLRKEQPLSGTQSTALNEYLQRLLKHEPVQYIMNKAWFYGMELYVDRAVLIPRPETEELVEWIINDVKSSGKDVFIKKPMKGDETTQLKILDVGTGSGCIALALKKNMPRAEVWGCDKSEEALNIARRNGSALNIRVDFQGTDFLNETQQKHLPTADIVVSNPPYVPLRDKEEMAPNVITYEPHTALFVPDDDATIFYKALASFGEHRLYANGAIYAEIHEGMGEAVAGLFQSAGYTNVELRKDMQGKNRMIRAVKA